MGVGVPWELPHLCHTPKLPTSHTLDSQTTLSGACSQVFCAPSPRASGGAHPSLPPRTHAALSGGQALAAPVAPRSSSSSSWPEAPISGGRSGPAACPMTHARAEGSAPSESQAGRPLAPPPRGTHGPAAWPWGHLGTPVWLCCRQGPPLCTAHVLWGLGEGRTRREYRQEPSSGLRGAEHAPPPRRPTDHAPRHCTGPMGLTCLLKDFHMRPRAVRTTAQWRTQYAFSCGCSTLAITSASLSWGRAS